MTLDLTKPVQTRDGRPVKLITPRERNPEFPVTGYIGTLPYVDMWTLDGRFIPERPNCHDLINIPDPKRVVDFWVNVYPLSISGVHLSKELAEINKTGERLDCIHIRWTEGKGAEVIND